MLTLVFVFGGLTPIPRTFLTLAAGIVYGMAAVPIIIPATTAGCLLVFLLVRYLFGERVWRYVERKPKLLAIMDAVNAEGWRIVGLCRLASPVPSMVQNAIFGLTRIGAWPFTWATFVFIIPQVDSLRLSRLDRARGAARRKQRHQPRRHGGGRPLLPDRGAADRAARARRHAQPRWRGAASRIGVRPAKLSVNDFTQPKR